MHGRVLLKAHCLKPLTTLDTSSSNPIPAPRCTSNGQDYPHRLCILKGIQYDVNGLSIWQSGSNVSWVSGRVQGRG